MISTHPLSPHNLELFLKRIRDIPSLPEVVNKITEMLGKQNTPASEIAHLISYDPGLTTRVLRMVNSAAFGFPRQISSVQHSIMILGFNATRGLVLSASIFKMFDGEGPDHHQNYRKFLEHSLSTAFAARILLKFYEFPSNEDTFSAALLHDVGKMVLNVYCQAEQRAGAFDFFLTPAEEKERFGMSHTEIGALLATRWKLPVSITEVIQYHHTPEKATLSQPLVYWVAFSNELTRAVRPGGKASLTPADISPSIRRYFSLEQEMLTDIIQALQAEMEAAGDWLNLFS